MDNSQKLAAAISLTLTTILFLSLTQLSQWRPVYVDDFENFPTNWSTDTRNVGTVTRSTNQKLSGTHSLRIHTPSETDNAYAYTPIPGGTIEDLHIQLWFYVDYTVVPDHVYIAEFRDSEEKDNNRIVVDDDEGVCFVKQLLPGNGYDPANYARIGQVTRDEWHKLDVYRYYTTDTYNIIIDDFDYGTFRPPYPEISVEYLYLGDSTVGGFKGLLYFDDLIMERPR